MRLLSIILSFRNESNLIPELIRRLRSALDPLKEKQLNYELIFVNDNSSDNSLDVLRGFADDKRVKFINMSRRFGVSECVMAGMERAQGDAVVTMDTDLQDPPELLPQIVDAWEKGADVVSTVRTRRLGESVFKIFLTRISYRVINFLSEIPLAVEAGDFKLMSRRVAQEVLKLPDRTLYLRGLVTWVGFREVQIHYERQQRASGTTHFPFFGAIVKNLATFHGPQGTLLSGIIGFSVMPLILVFLSGLAAAGLAGLYFLATVISAAIHSSFGLEPFWRAAITLLISINLLGMGIIALYLAVVLRQTRNRPHYIAESTHGFKETH